MRGNTLPDKKYIFQNPDKKLKFFDSAKSYLRKQVTIGRSATGDLDKSAALATFPKKSEKSLIFQHHFGNPAPNRD